MKWYISKLVFRIDDPSARVAQFDEQWRMVEAASEPEALQKAREIGERESELLVKSNGQPMRWAFMCVTDLFAFSPSMDGAEIFSRIEQPENERMYLLSLAAKSKRYETEEKHARMNE